MGTIDEISLYLPSESEMLVMITASNSSKSLISFLTGIPFILSLSPIIPTIFTLILKDIMMAISDNSELSDKIILIFYF